MLKWFLSQPPFSDPKGFFLCCAICYGIVTASFFWLGGPMSLMLLCGATAAFCAVAAWFWPDK